MADFCLFVCSDQFQISNNGLEYVRFIQNLSQQLGIELTHYAFASSEEENLYIEGYFDKNALYRLEKLIVGSRSFAISIWSDKHIQEDSYYALNSQLTNMVMSGDYKYLFIQIPMDYVLNQISSTLFLFARDLLISLDQIAVIDYALCTQMNSAVAGLFFNGAFTDEISDEEAMDLAIWNSRLDERNTKLRGLYLGNLLGPGHLSQISNQQEFIARLDTLIGNQSIAIINNHSLFFMLPSPNLASDSVAISVHSLLESYNLLMEPDDQARESFNSYKKFR